ncbi:glycosyltransferase family 4 protein [Patescibacteria group bacterium]|nr:glycosyltransferase family 4 protein [Patescibacteria group bacterium]
MRILLVSPLYPPDIGRLASYTKTIATRLQEHEEVSLLTYGTLPEAIPGVRIQTVPKTWPLLIRVVFFTLRLWWEARTADILYVGDGASVGAPAIIVGKLRHLPVIRFVLQDEAWERAQSGNQSVYLSEADYAQTDVPDRKIRRIRWLQRWVLRRATISIVPTLSLKTIFTRVYGAPLAKVHVLSYPLERRPLLPFTVERASHQLFVPDPLHMGDGLERLLECLPKLLKLFPSLHLFIANGHLATSLWKKQVEILGVAEHVTFLGTISRAEKEYYYQSSSLLLLTHSIPDYSDEILQGYAASIPIIATDVAGHQELIRHEKTGLLIPTGDAVVLQQAIQRGLTDEPLRTRMIQGGALLLKERASLEQHLQELHTLYKIIRNPSSV